MTCHQPVSLMDHGCRTRRASEFLAEAKPARFPLEKKQLATMSCQKKSEESRKGGIHDTYP